MTVDFTNKPLNPITSTFSFSAASRIALIGCLMPIFTTSYPLLDKMISTRFFPISCTSPFTVASKILPRPSSSVFSIFGSKNATANFITSAEESTKGSCISPLPNNSPTVFIPSSRWSLMIAKGLIPSAIAKSKSASSPARSPSMIRLCNLSCNGKRSNSSALLARPEAASTPSKRSRNLVSGSYVTRSFSYFRRS
ncbi:unannotated protein [freshwater metagenome]|uniref:Unannotated protein n=1 Tax=freshwater metagenome TaxID=449393 RepID=A0A6J6WI16_9ZZZZ